MVNIQFKLGEKLVSMWDKKKLWTIHYLEYGVLKIKKWILYRLENYSHCKVKSDTYAYKLATELWPNL